MLLLVDRILKHFSEQAESGWQLHGEVSDELETQTKLCVAQLLCTQLFPSLQPRGEPHPRSNLGCPWLQVYRAESLWLLRVYSQLCWDYAHISCAESTVCYSAVVPNLILSYVGDFHSPIRWAHVSSLTKPTTFLTC